MTTAETLRAEGFAKGHDEGRADGDGFKDWMARTSRPEAVEEILDRLRSMFSEPASGEPESPGADGEEGSREG